MRILLMLSMMLVALLSITMVSAAATRVNITMTETVDQNITFAKDFTLTEATPYCTITGIINVTNPNADTIADINLTYTNTDNMLGNFTYVGGRTGSQVKGKVAGTDDFIIHIVELRQNDYSAYTYTINCSDVPPPLDIETTYSNVETGINRKVLAGHNWTILQNATNQLEIDVPINNINITIEAMDVIWNGTSDSFLLQMLDTYDDWQFVYGNGSSTSLWWWEVNNGTLSGLGSWETIRYDAQAPFNVPTSDTYMAVRENLSYQIFYLASNLSLQTVTAVADLEFELDKQIISPADNNNNTNVTWEVNSDINVPLNIAYNLTTVSLWVTSTLDPTNNTIPTFGKINTTFTPKQEINRSSPYSTPAWEFNYTDASNNNNRPPIVWLRPYFTILNSYNQIVNSTVTQNGNDIYMKYIYVVNGYWLQIDKNITSVGTDMYRIDTLVQNIGNAWTPQGLVVTVYDFVPTEFSPWNWTVGADSNGAVSGQGFNGTAYRWTIAGKQPYNASLGPPSSGTGNSTWTVSYTVNGSGDYKVSELYIVGLDPRKVDGAGTHEGITLISAFGSSSAEVFYVAVVLFLVIINVVNFIMTRRINQKLKD